MITSLRSIRLGILAPLLALACAAVSEPQEPLDVSVSLISTTARRGTPFEISVEVRNTGSRSITINATSGCFTDFELLRATGDDILGRSGQGCTQALSSRTLSANQAFKVRHIWIPGGPGQLDLPAGAYRVRGVLLHERGDQLGAVVPFTLVQP